jgi:hypothetical protein
MRRLRDDPCAFDGDRGRGERARSEQVNLCGPVLAEIFKGKISKWNDKKIAALNPKAKLPSTTITPIFGWGRGSWRPDKGRGRIGHGPGRLGPWPRRPGVRGVEERSRERHGSATDPSPMSGFVRKVPRTSPFLASSSDV